MLRRAPWEYTNGMRVVLQQTEISNERTGRRERKRTRFGRGYIRDSELAANII